MRRFDSPLDEASEGRHASLQINMYMHINMSANKINQEIQAFQKEMYEMATNGAKIDIIRSKSEKSGWLNIG